MGSWAPAIQKIVGAQCKRGILCIGHLLVRELIIPVVFGKPVHYGVGVVTGGVNSVWVTRKIDCRQP